MKKLILLSVFILVVGVNFTFAQDDSDSGVWSEIIVVKPLNKKTDLVFGGRFETKSNNSEVQEVRGYAGVSIKKAKWTFTPQFAYIRWQLRNGRYINESRPMLIVSRKFQTKGSKWSANIGMRTEFRIRPGKNDWRFVPGLGVEKELTKKVKFINRNEFWFDTRKGDPTTYRIRTFNGINYSFNKHYSIEPLFLYQRDEKYSPKNVFKAVIYLRIKL